MKEREFLVVGGLVVLLLLIWLGFPLHQSPRFAGSFWGGVLAVSGSTLMLIPLLYLVIKRIKPLKRAVTKRISMRTLLAWHIYAGILGPILVIIHTGHKFESSLGIALTAMVLTVVLSGFVGRYLMSRVKKEINAKRELLEEATGRYQDAVEEISSKPDQISLIRFARSAIARSVLQYEEESLSLAPAGIRAVALAETVADLEFAVRTHEMFKRVFGIWLKAHIALSVALYLLLAIHVWAAFYFGIRWFH